MSTCTSDLLDADRKSFTTGSFLPILADYRMVAVTHNKSFRLSRVPVAHSHHRQQPPTTECSHVSAALKINPPASTSSDHLVNHLVNGGYTEEN